MPSRFIIFQTSLGLALVIATAIACNPTHQRPEHLKKTGLGGGAGAGGSGPGSNNKPDATYQASCTDNLQIDALASEKEVSSLSEALTGKTGTFTLTSATIFESLSGPAAGNSTLYLAAELTSQKSTDSVRSGAQITCQNTSATSGGKVQGTTLDAHLVLPNEINANDGSIPHILNLDAVAEQGQGRAQATTAAGKASQTVKDYDTAMAHADNNMERKVVYVVDNDGRIHLRAQEKYTLGDGSVAVKKYEVLFTARPLPSVPT